MKSSFIWQQSALVCCLLLLSLSNVSIVLIAIVAFLLQSANAYIADKSRKTRKPLYLAIGFLVVQYAIPPIFGSDPKDVETMGKTVALPLCAIGFVLLSLKLFWGQKGDHKV